MEIIESELLSWGLRSVGAPDAGKTVLLLPGGLGTAHFYDDVLRAPALQGQDVRFVAATPPGFGGRPGPDDLTVEHYASLAGDLAAELDADLVVGHSLGANHALEMVAGEYFAGPIVLLSPTFSAQDEEADFRRIARLSRLPIVGRVPWIVFPHILDSSFKGRLPAHRHHELIAEMKTFDMQLTRRMVVAYFEYLDRRAPLTSRLCDAGVPTWVAFGQRDEIGLTDNERRTLQACPHLSLVEIPDAAHFVMTDQPDHTLDLILQALHTDNAA
jgi:pimeloyl-ACP methyl ester carboxylesterase